jgi:3-deoxy-manno-octulosonate cytidylyltransferase (CMP-KDO synthetase)
MTVRTVIVIPARYGATRLPGKPLLDVGGEPMIVRVWRRCCLVPEAERIVVATDDARIHKAVTDAGGEAVMTSPGHRSGTDRIAEAAEAMECDIVVNVQGDEPFIEPASLSLLIEPLSRNGGAEAATLATPIRERKELYDPSVVKVVVNRKGEAVYFSRYPVPYAAELWQSGDEPWRPAESDSADREASPYLRHVGTYAYRKGFLAKFRSWEAGEAERRESLEQLRILEEGEKISVVIVKDAAGGVDTPEDLVRARAEAGA